MRIIFYCNWGSNSTDLLNRYRLFTKNNEGIFNSIQGVDNINIADGIVFIEGIPNNFNYDLLINKKVFCFPREPNVKIKNWAHLNLEYGFTYRNFYHVVTNPQFIDKTYDFLENLKYKESNKNLSAIISNKNLGNGYSLRLHFITELAKNKPELCDIYGAGWKNELGVSYKGELGCYHKHININKTKFDALIDYKYSICIENCKIPNYFSEKFTDSILCWTIPIYWGCTNISDYFPENSYYSIDIESLDVNERIKEIINKPITDENIEALKNARELIINKYNIWSTIDNLK